MTTTPPLSPWPDDDPWALLRAEAHRGGPEYRELLAAHRVLQDRLAGGAPPPELAARLASTIRDVSEQLAEHQAAESERWDGWDAELPGRGMPVLPPYLVDETTEASLRGHVTFTRFYLGGNAAAHGGTPPLLFDDVFGRIANHGFPGIARTAFLKVNYRRITPLDVELTFDANRDRIEGRKRWVTGRLYTPDGAVCCDAEGLFLQLLPGQP